MSSELIQEESRCIAHEIRNHTSICEIYTTIIKKALADNNIKNDTIERALLCIQKSVKMINNSVIDLNSLNNLKPTYYEAGRLINESIALSRVYIHDKEIQIEPVINADGQIFVDENKFLACLINLIKNAIEAIDEKGKIIVQTEFENKCLLIKVANNGKEIPKEVQEDLFSAGVTTKKTGSGLGLFICKNNLELQNAKLSLIKSDKNSTEFQIKIPLK